MERKMKRRAKSASKQKEVGRPAMHFNALGHVVLRASKRLETFAAPAHVTEVVMQSVNFTSVCPITGQPDYAQVSITYAPNKLCLESKSLKLYLMTFRNQGVFAEQLSETIALDVLQALQAFRVTVTVSQSPRGDIAIQATSKVSEMSLTK